MSWRSNFQCDPRRVFSIAGLVYALTTTILPDRAIGSPPDSPALLIICETDTLLIGDHLESYNRVTHGLVLTTAGYWRWTSYVNHLRRGGQHLAPETLLTNKPFRIEYGGEVVARGHIHSGTQSKLFTGLTLFDSEGEFMRGRLSLLYGRYTRETPPSPLENEDFLAYFRQTAKLRDWRLDR